MLHMQMCLIKVELIRAVGRTVRLVLKRKLRLGSTAGVRGESGAALGPKQLHPRV